MRFLIVGMLMLIQFQVLFAQQKPVAKKANIGAKKPAIANAVVTGGREIAITLTPLKIVRSIWVVTLGKE